MITNAVKIMHAFPCFLYCVVHMHGVSLVNVIAECTINAHFADFHIASVSHHMLIYPRTTMSFLLTFFNHRTDTQWYVLL